MDDIIRPKCCNASYCKHSKDEVHCDADDKIAENCLYLKAINQIALLSMELTERYDGYYDVKNHILDSQ